MRTLKLTLEYNGAGFSGFQRQKNGRTVQEELERALHQFLHEQVAVIGAGRTDAGVHAVRQAAHIRIANPMAAEAIGKALNGILPRDMAVKKVEEVSPDFHARYNARGKIYQYYVWNSRVRSPLNEAVSWQYPVKLDITRMKRAAKMLTGRHDFKSFQSSGSSKEMSTVRTLARLEIHKKGQLLSFLFEGDGFLYNMVRNIVGTLVWVGEGKLSGDMSALFQARDRRKAGPTAPAKGLFLVRVKY
ncbi:MAG: tRNA pseudouridine(38-40) synthase TruA [Candidatus Omnitrophica bacterium]|nr:tRNA pseudouridine(38-40) synthase TruA [Candidatus Omnitrophota bacterium]